MRRRAPMRSLAAVAALFLAGCVTDRPQSAVETAWADANVIPADRTGSRWRGHVTTASRQSVRIYADSRVSGNATVQYPGEEGWQVVYDYERFLRVRELRVDTNGRILFVKVAGPIPGGRDETWIHRFDLVARVCLPPERIAEGPMAGQTWESP